MESFFNYTTELCAMIDGCLQGIWNCCNGNVPFECLYFDASTPEILKWILISLDISFPYDFLGFWQLLWNELLKCVAGIFVVSN